MANTEGCELPSEPKVRSSELVGRLERHIAQMAIHQKERRAGQLLIEAHAELKRLHKICGSKECVMCKRLVPYVQQFVSTDKTHPLCETCWLEKEGKPPNEKAKP